VQPVPSRIDQLRQVEAVPVETVPEKKTTFVRGKVVKFVLKCTCGHESHILARKIKESFFPTFVCRKCKATVLIKELY